LDIIATYFNKSITELPKDLYIPPAALKVFLELFEGPLDLLLYLIRKQNIEILEIPIDQITSQYIQYINAMQSLNIELAAEYLLMAALLIEIKSKMLLPPKANPDEEPLEGSDPRTDLIRQLLEYERIKKASEELARLPQADVDFRWVNIGVERNPEELIYTTPQDLYNAFRSVLLRNIQQNKTQTIKKQHLSIREYMKNILKYINEYKTVSFEQIIQLSGATIAIIITSFIAILELIRDNTISFSIHDKQILLSSYE